MKDHIVEEVQKIRQKQAAKFGYDVAAIMQDARKRQSKSGHRVVSYVVKKKKAA
ncbi:MAG: hypothetical protein AB1705_05300 [Verrucomicrobiota bacterium]